MKNFILTLTFVLSLTTFLHAQAPVKTEAAKPDAAPVSTEVSASETIINNKPMSQLSDDEIKKFIQAKVKSICQWDKEAALLRVAQGYPVTLTFPEAVRSYSVGDEKMISAQNANAKELRVAALTRTAGNTTLQVVTKSEKRYIYYIFVVEDFSKADLVVCVDQGWFFKITKWIPKLITLAVIGAAGFFFYKKFKK